MGKKRKLRSILTTILLTASIMFFLPVVNTKTNNAYAITTDQKIAGVFGKYFARNKDIIGIGLVNTQTGEIMSKYVFNLAMVEGKSELFAAIITDIVHSLSDNLKKADLDFSEAVIRCGEGAFFLKKVNGDVCIVAFFKPRFNLQEARLIIRNKIYPRVLRILEGGE